MLSEDTYHGSYVVFANDDGSYNIWRTQQPQVFTPEMLTGNNSDSRKEISP